MPTNHFQCNSNIGKCQCDFPYIWTDGTGSGLNAGGCTQCEQGYIMKDGTCGMKNVLLFYFELDQDIQN